MTQLALDMPESAFATLHQAPQKFAREMRIDAVVVDERQDQAARKLAKQPWPVREVAVVSPRVAAWGLGVGETAVLSHALANPTPTLRAVVDDLDARRCAQTLGIPLLGMGGILVLAKRRGLLSSVDEGLEKLRQAGLWLAEDVVRILKAQAGE